MTVPEVMPPDTTAGALNATEEVKELRSQLECARAELADARRTIEIAVGQANQMALEAQIAAIEIRQLVNVSHDALWVVDSEFHIVRVSESMVSLVGGTAATLKGRVCSEVFSYGLCGTPNCPIKRLADGGGADSVEMDVTSQHPPDRSFIANIAPYYGIDGDVYGIVASFKDITDRKRAEAELERLATRDGLTGLCNRRQFDLTFEKEWQRARRDRLPLSVILSDVDHFKQFNDSYGHQAGDQCLREVAQALGQAVKRPADLAARYGGEEFVALLPSTDQRGAAVVAEQMRARVAALAIPHARSSAGPCVTMSFGCATLMPGSAELATGVLDRADRSLYEAKKSGRNCVVSSPEFSC